jgi:protein TonB
VKLPLAVAIATAAHLIVGIILWRTWPVQIPEGEVVPLELRPVEAPPAPAPPVVAEPAVAPPGSGDRKAANSTKPVGKTIAKPIARPIAKIELAVAAPEKDGELAAESITRPPAPVAEPAVASGGATGAGGKVGGVGSSEAGIVKPVDHRALLGEAMERIRQHRRYPELARRRRLEGTVVVAFRVGEKGEVTNARVKRGVDEILDEAALDAVIKAAPLPAPLATDGELEVDLHFTLQP